MKTWKAKIKIIVVWMVSFVVFAMTFFAMAENSNNNSLFLDSDQDGLTDQEERMIGTDPYKADTDGDGYSDGKEVESGYNPLKPAPGDKIVTAAPLSTATSNAQQGNPNESSTANLNSLATNTDLLSQLSPNLLDNNNSALTDLSSDPSNPNLTNEMIGQLMKLTEEKAASSESFKNNPVFTTDDLNQIVQNTFQTADIEKDLPDIQDSELNILPPVEGKKMSEKEIKAKQKAEIEKYLAQVAFVLASNSPFAVENPNHLKSDLDKESTNLLTALTTGDTSKIDSYAQRAQTGIDQLKKVEIPYVLKDFHKSILQLAIYTLNLKSDVLLNASDPMKSLIAVSSLQAVVQSATKLQNELSQILASYGIESIGFP